MPTKVRVRVGLYAALGLALAIWPRLVTTSDNPTLSIGWTALVLGLGAYVAWCFWPKWAWGLGYDPLSLLPVPQGQTVRLSFDDGPTPGLTDRILDLLAAHGIKASFFVLMVKARVHPHLIRRIVDEGHALGLHGEDHRAPFFRSPGELRASLDGARIELEQIAGTPIGLYRPSHGWKNLALLLALRSLPLKICGWHFGVWDTDAPPADVLTARLMRVTPRSESSGRPIVLLHDGLNDVAAMPAHAAPLLDSLRRWLPATRSAA